MRNVLVIDVGTHKAEEVKLFDGRPAFSVTNRLRLLRRGKSIGEILRLSTEFKARFRCRYVLIEPVMHRELLEFVRLAPATIMIGGVSSCAPSGPTTLFMAHDSLGNSIVPTKPGLTGKTLDTFNLDFRTLYEFLIESFIKSGDCSQVILRINAEGVEGPIIDFLAHSAAVKPNVIAGSIGDIKKCFGQDAYDRAVTTLERANIPFVYFTSSSTTWSSGLTQITAALN